MNGTTSSHDVRLRVYVFDAGPDAFMVADERVLCQHCWPRWVENWERIGCFHDYVADADPAREECFGCGVD